MKVWVNVSLVALLSSTLLLPATAWADLFVGRLRMLHGHGQSGTQPWGGVLVPAARPGLGADDAGDGANAVGAALVLAAGRIQVKTQRRVVSTTVPSLLVSTTVADWANGAGTLSSGGGPGNVDMCAGAVGGIPGNCGSIPSTSAGTRPGWVHIAKGPRQFGGVLAVLGSQKSFVLSSSPVYHPPTTYGFARGTIPLAIGAIGGAFAGTATDTGTIDFTNFPTHLSSSQYARVTGLQWTTGQVMVRGASPVSHTTFTISGYDTVSNGYRNIQLVTGFLHHYETPVMTDETVGYAVMRLQFVPEPGASLLLAVGLGALTLTGALHARRSRARATSGPREGPDLR